MKKLILFILILIPLTSIAQETQPTLMHKTKKLIQDLIKIKDYQYGYACTNNLRMAIDRTKDAKGYMSKKEYTNAYESLSHTRNLVEYCRYSGCTRTTDLYYALNDTKEIMKVLRKSKAVQYMSH